MGSLKEKLEERRKKKMKIKGEKKTSMELFQKEVKEEEKNEKINSIGKKKKKKEKGNNSDTGKIVQIGKEKNIKVEGKKSKSHKKKGKTEEDGGLDERHDNGATGQSPSETQGDIDNFKAKSEAIDGTETRTRKSKKFEKKKKKKRHGTSKESEKLLEKKEAVEDGVYYISSGEEDCSKGMKKWLLEYHQSRPGLNVLQQRIDDSINAHEEKLEQEREEREAEAAKDGWTVVVHHKGRKKTTDTESGITVGSVAPAVAESMLTTKKSNEVKLDFYRFQKREAQRNEILALQNKFEEDRKRIQQLRAARKFRPY